MTKEELVKKISKETGLDKTVVSTVVEHMMTGIKGSLINDRPVYLRGFGTFKNITRRQKTARDIGRHTTILVPEHKVPCFKPCKILKDEIR